MLEFQDRAPIIGVRKTADGYLVADVRVARTGIQEYQRSEIGMDGAGTVRIFRPEGEVFDKAAAASYAHRPVTMGHPPEPVSADNWKALAVGQTGDEIVRDGDYIRVPLVLMDAAAIKAVEDGTRELSMGYSATIEMRDGTTPDGQQYDAVQTGLRMNHLAIVAEARGGSKLKIGDTQPQEKATMADSKLRAVIVDGLSVETTDAGAQAIEKLQKQITDAAATHDKAIAAKDAEAAKKDAKIAELESQIVDAAALDKLVQERATLVEDAAKVAGKPIEATGVDAAQIRKAAVIARMGDKALDGKSDVYAEAMFNALRDGAVATKSDAFADGVKGGVKTDINDAWGEKVFASAGVKMKKG